MKIKNKKTRLSKKAFLNLAKDVYKTAKKEKAGILNLNIVLNEKHQGNILHYNFFDIEPTEFFTMRFLKMKNHLKQLFLTIK